MNNNQSLYGWYLQRTSRRSRFSFWSSDSAPRRCLPSFPFRNKETKLCEMRFSAKTILIHNLHPFVFLGLGAACSFAPNSTIVSFHLLGKVWWLRGKSLLHAGIFSLPDKRRSFSTYSWFFYGNTFIQTRRQSIFKQEMSINPSPNKGSDLRNVKLPSNTVPALEQYKQQHLFALF